MHWTQNARHGYKSVKEVVPVAIKAVGHAVGVVEKAKKKKVIFAKLKTAEEVDTEIVTTPETPEIADVSLKSVGDLFGKPSSSPVKQHVWRETSC